MSFFNDLKIEMDRVASYKMFRKGIDPDDIIFGKAMLHSNDTMYKIIKNYADNARVVINEK